MKNKTKKRGEEQVASRRLSLRKEILRSLDVADLVVVVGGVPQCTMTRDGAPL